MSADPTAISIGRGIALRIGQLRSWGSRIRERLDRQKSDSDEFRSAGAQALLKLAPGRVSRAEFLLHQAETDLAKDDQFLLVQIYLTLAEAEANLKAVERSILPPLLTRTKSDVSYDDFITRFLSDLNLTQFQPVTSHKQSRVLAVDPWFKDNPIFAFSPTIRSFEFLSLLYHEIGHVVWWHVLEDQHRRKLLDEVRKFSAPLNIEPTMNAVQEIAADTFGGIVGGHPYITNLCSFFLSKQSLDEQPSKEYPSPVLRVWLSRRASEIADCPKEDLSDPLIDAWDELLRLRQRQLPEVVIPQVDPVAVVDFAFGFGEILRELGIPSCGEHSRLSYSADCAPRIDDNTSKPALLLVASKYRSAIGWEKYRDWQNTVFEQLGLTHRSWWGRVIDGLGL